MISWFSDVSLCPKTIYLYFGGAKHFQLIQEKSISENSMVVIIKILEAQKFESFGKGGRRKITKIRDFVWEHEMDIW